VTTVLLPSTLSGEPVVPPGVRTVRYAVKEPLPDDLLDADALVVWANPTWQVQDAAARMRRVRWVQTLAAGPDVILEAGFAPDVVVTSGAGLHDGPVAEHTLAMLLGVVRRLPTLVRAQDEHRWALELSGGRQARAVDELRSLAGAHVVVWGFGSIAARLSPMLVALGARVTGVARRPGRRAGFDVVTADDLPRLLPTADVLIGLLPSTRATRHVIDADVLALLPAHAWVVNVGRGSTLDEAALLDAIGSGGLAGAALDVFETEPLPADSPLWDERRILISPHGAGGRPVGGAELVADNIAAFVTGQPLRNVVER